MYFVNMTTGFLPLLLSDHGLHYISVEKISVFIVRYKLLLKTIIPMHEKKNHLGLSTFTYLTLHIHFLWHPTVTGTGEITHMLSMAMSRVSWLTVPLHSPAGTVLSFSKSKSKFSCLFLKNQFKQNALLHKNIAAINVLRGLQRTLSACLQCSIDATGWVPNSASC